VQNPCDSSADDDEVVTDSLTGLMWQRTLVAGIKWQEALDYCGTLNYGGYQDWRLPNPLELHSLVNYNGEIPMIDMATFPGAHQAKTWSSLSYLADNSLAWDVNFNTGGLVALSQKNVTTNYTGCVRAGSTMDGSGPLDNFIPAGSTEQIVTDVVTGLIWQRSYVANKTWAQAMAYCEGLVYGGYSDWRLPNVNEILSLTDYNRSSPASCFPGDSSLVLWTATSYNDTTQALYLDLRSGAAIMARKNYKNDARCVRGGP